MAVMEPIDSSWEAVPHAALDAHGGHEMRWRELATLSFGDTVSTALFKAFSNRNQRPDRTII